MQLLSASQHAPGQGLFGVHVPPGMKVPLKQPTGPVTVQAEVSGMQHVPVGHAVGVQAPGMKIGLGHWNIGTAVHAPVAGSQHAPGQGLGAHVPVCQAPVQAA